MMNPKTIRELEQERETRPLRVLHVLDHSWPVHSGYSFRSLHLIAAQKHLGLQPIVLTGPLQSVDDPQASDVVLDGVSYNRTPFSGWLSEWAITRRRPILRELMVVRLLKQRILKLIAQHPVDIIHAHSPVLCGLAALQAARSTRTAFVYELRAFWEDAGDPRKAKSLRYMVSRKMEDYVVHRANAVVGIAQSILKDLEARQADPKKLFHVPNGVDIRKFSPAARDSALAAQLGVGKVPVLGFIGSLYHWEGAAWLVRAVSELRRRGVACELLLIGDGEEMPAVRAAVREQQAQDFVHVIGKVPHEQVEQYYSVIDVLVYPRHRSRLTELVTPLKPLEAMALGKAVLGSDVGGIRELIDPEQTGLLFRADEVDDFCRQAGRLLDDPALREALGARARDLVLREKDWAILAKRYVKVYEAALQDVR